MSKLFFLLIKEWSDRLPDICLFVVCPLTRDTRHAPVPQNRGVKHIPSEQLFDFLSGI